MWFDHHEMDKTLSKVLSKKKTNPDKVFSTRFPSKRDQNFFRSLLYRAFKRQRIDKTTIYNDHRPNSNIIRFFQICFYVESIKIICLHIISRKNRMGKNDVKRKKTLNKRSVSRAIATRA